MIDLGRADAFEARRDVNSAAGRRLVAFFVLTLA
jgi:hypothetical protein